MLRPFLTTCAAALCLCGTAAATTYLPVTFGDLIARADVIFVGEVADVRPRPVSTREGLIVRTLVVFRVADPLWGTTSALETFEFLGGEWGDLGMAIAGMPAFAVGERHVVFARREQSINPIVGFTQGLLRVARDGAGVDRVFTQEGLPLAAPAQIGTRRAPGAALETPMPLSDLRARIAAALADTRAR